MYEFSFFNYPAREGFALRARPTMESLAEQLNWGLYPPTHAANETKYLSGEPL